MGTIFEIWCCDSTKQQRGGRRALDTRDVVELMADLVFTPIADQVMDATYSCYDGACGTGGMLTVAQDRLMSLAEQAGKQVSIHLFGQEINPETYAIAKADMLLKGDGAQAEHISFGSTLSIDQNASRQFDFMLSNPPYGKSWKVERKRWAEEGYSRQPLQRLSGKREQVTMIPRPATANAVPAQQRIQMKKDTALGSRSRRCTTAPRCSRATQAQARATRGVSH
jgi:type I restriction enzyme M protein